MTVFRSTTIQGQTYENSIGFDRDGRSLVIFYRADESGWSWHLTSYGYSQPEYREESGRF